MTKNLYLVEVGIHDLDDDETYQMEMNIWADSELEAEGLAYQAAEHRYSPAVILDTEILSCKTPEQIEQEEVYNDHIREMFQ